MGAYDLPSWLQGSPSEGAQLLIAGANAGSQIGANILRGRQLSLQRQQMDEERRQFDAIMPLKQKLAEQQFTLGELKLKDTIRQQQEMIDSEKAFSNVSSEYARHQAMGIAGTPGSEAAIRYKIANNPAFWVHPGSKDLVTDMMLSKKTLEGIDKLEISDADKAALDMFREAERTKRSDAANETKLDVAEIGGDYRLQAAIARAEASARSLLNTKEYQTFMARKQSVVNDVTMSYDQKEAKIVGLENEYHIVRKTDAGTDVAPKTSIPSVPTAAPSPVSEEKVRVMSPNGKSGTIPKSQLDEALKNGYSLP